MVKCSTHYKSNDLRSQSNVTRHCVRRSIAKFENELRKKKKTYFHSLFSFFSPLCCSLYITALFYIPSHALSLKRNRDSILSLFVTLEQKYKMSTYLEKFLCLRLKEIVLYLLFNLLFIPLPSAFLAQLVSASVS